ncbi:phosphatase PAP2 family protein [Candidatus Parcubacteria bacterium]|uniref:PA-phosphatase n=1 Tax=Candidatus Magasanikbacteria bacterium CG10_big_fil_rev_8_21_14_0_10_38_6 TaxID=1974647 RepID=A0A2M6P189_9BACT|nr:phosphatase PAP2 family protein [Candidatus Parcubacteria bacterium]PIR77464.1 MAG: PA-phosphatase [Candidatus Magasanikbacteria bacterium CG10_big_fil_rev_8_21_14_0_10_38_6]
MDIVHALLPTIEHIHIIGYWIALLLALSETFIGVGLFIPGSTALLFMGAMAAGGSFDIGDLIFFAVCGAVIGDNLNYFIGRLFGDTLYTKGFLFITPDHIKKARVFFDKHGAKSVFLGRFVPTFKEFTPLVAGILRMKRLSFTIWNILGAIGWSLVWILPGYFFAQSLNTAKLWLSRTEFLFFFLFLFFVLFYIVKYIFIRKGQKIFRFIRSLWRSVKVALGQNEEITTYKRKHPHLVLFIKKRLEKDVFWGRMATYLFVAFVYVLLLFGGVIEDVINSDTITAVDIRVSHLMLLFRDTELVNIFLWVTCLGKSTMVLLVTICALLIFWVIKKRQYIVPFIITVSGSIGFNYIGKWLFHRPRPEMAVYIEKSFSFPSGHATIAVALYGFLLYILLREVKTWKRKVNIFFVGILVIVLIGFSRLYLGVHYVSDVWSGYLLGFLWLIIGISITEYICRNTTLCRSQFITRRAKLAAWGIVGGVSLVYVFFAFHYTSTIVVSQGNTVDSTTVVSQPTDVFSSLQSRYTETLSGNQQEPINFIILAKDDTQFIELFNESGWKLADRIDLYSLIKIAGAAIYKNSYDTAPMTPSFWDTKTHDFGFEKPTQVDNVRQRHHARFWKTPYVTAQGDTLYVGTASFDQNLKWGITHQISPDIDTEREFLFTDIMQSGVSFQYTKEKTVDPILGTNFTGDQFFTDGDMYIITIVSDN